MSDFAVKVCRITNVRRHPNADRLDMMNVQDENGWQVIGARHGYENGDLAVFIPPDSVISTELGDVLCVTKYLSPMPSVDGVRDDTKRRVRATRLRGCVSFGLLCPIDTASKYVGHPISRMPDTDITDEMGITKYEPPLKETAGDSAPDHPWFHQYTKIKNIKNYPNLIKDGTEVVISEKIHGSNVRIGFVAVADDDGKPTMEYMAGSHRVRRSRRTESGDMSKSVYWRHLKDVHHILHDLSSRLPGDAVIVFGELTGLNKGMRYGHTGGQTSLKVFDISLSGSYMDFDDLSTVCHAHGVEMVPHLYRGPFSHEIVEELTYGDTMLIHKVPKGGFAGKEGCVVRPVHEAYDGQDRVILKSISADYLSRNNIEDSH